MKSNLLKRLEEERSDYSKRQRLIADYILKNYEKAAYMTAAKLAAATQASESTVVRFAAELGYDGYPAMQKDLQDTIKSKLTAMQRIEVASDKMGGNVIDSVLRMDAESILSTIEEVDREEFNKAVECILSARNIYIIGVRAASSLASFLGFYLNLLFPNVHIISTISMSEMFEQILRISSGDVFIGISFPRYSRRTLKAMNFARDRGADVIAITDSVNSPMCNFAKHKIVSRSGMVSFADSIVAPMSLINALIAAVSISRESDIKRTLSTLETIWDEYDEYEKLDNE